MKKNILVLFSGGADSTLLLLIARKISERVGAVTFNYGQKNLAELVSARNLLEKHPSLCDERYYAELDLRHVTSPLLEGKGCAPRHGVNEKHVPARNLMFVAHAAAIAESQGFDEIWYGANFTSRMNSFPDCTQEWVFAMDRVLAINGSRRISLRAPLLGVAKDDIWLYLKMRGIDRTEVFSGYGE
jgi:7-cyano-7-deazaguanine synthase